MTAEAGGGWMVGWRLGGGILRLGFGVAQYIYCQEMGQADDGPARLGEVTIASWFGWTTSCFRLRLSITIGSPKLLERTDVHFRTTLWMNFIMLVMKHAFVQLMMGCAGVW